METHDLTGGWSLTSFGNGSLAIHCSDPSVEGVALTPEQAACLRKIINAEPVALVRELITAISEDESLGGTDAEWFAERARELVAKLAA